MTTAYLSTGSHILDIHGLQQCYHVHGRGPVCIVHPGGPGISWRYMRMPALEKRMTVVYLEPIGTGESARLDTHPTGYTVDRYVQQLAGFLKALDLKDVLLLGHSHGGFVVQALALSGVALVRGIVLYSTSAVTGPSFMSAAAARVEELLVGMPEQTAVRVSEAWERVPRMESDTDYTETLRSLLPVYVAPSHHTALLHRLGEELEASLVRGDVEPFDVRDDLPRLRTPALILTGRHDFICGPAYAHELATLVRAGKVVVFDDSGHLSHLEQPEEFAQSIETFANQLCG